VTTTETRPTVTSGGAGNKQNFINTAKVQGTDDHAPRSTRHGQGTCDVCGMATTGLPRHPGCDDAFAFADVPTGPPVEDSATVRAALRYAADGIFVFPVSLRLADSGKKVASPIASWREASTTSERTIREWFGPGGAWESAVLAIDCGKSQLVVVDPDEGVDATGRKKNGIANWARIVEEYGIPATWRAATPGGGEHWYFRENRRRVVGIDSSGKVAEDVDIRGMGGFVFAPPSQHEGGAWRWVEGEPEWSALPTVPDVVADRMNRKAAEPPPEPTRDSRFDAPGFTSAQGPRLFTRQEALDFCRPYWKALETAPDGHINFRLNDAAKVMSHFNGVFWSEQEAESLLLGFLRSTVYDGKTWKAEATIKSAFGSAAGDWKAQQRPEGPPQPDPQKVATLRERMRARLHTRDTLDTIEPPTPLIEGVLDKGTIALLSGKFGTYKTFVSLAWACSVATGTAWEGLPVVTPGPVLYVAAEGCSGLRSRVRAWEIGQNQGRRIPAAQLAVFNGRVKLTDADEMAVLGEFITEMRPVLVVVDTLHQCAPGMDENSSKDMGTVLGAVAELRESYGATVLLNHHTGHQGERARGSSALEDDVDTSWVVTLDGESRAAENQRILKHRKAKDRELLAERPIMLRTVEEAGSAYVESGTLTPNATLPNSVVALKVIEWLDELGVPKTAGRPACEAALRQARRPVPQTAVMADAVKRRKGDAWEEQQ
jgi:hypothetical protein